METQTLNIQITMADDGTTVSLSGSVDGDTLATIAQALWGKDRPKTGSDVPGDDTPVQV